MASNASKAEQKQQRKKAMQARHSQQQKAKRLFWITGAAAIVVIMIAILAWPKAPATDFAYDELPRLGNADAPVKIVEFGDFKCPACKVFSEDIMPQLKQDYIDKGLVSFYFMNFYFIGPDSYTAAIAGRSVFHQNNDAFWKFYDAIYKNQPNENIVWATTDYLTDLARKENMGIDVDKLKADIESNKFDSEVKQHNKKAQKLIVSSTPTLFINGSKFENVFSYDAIKAAIEQALQETKNEAQS